MRGAFFLLPTMLLAAACSAERRVTLAAEIDGLGCNATIAGRHFTLPDDTMALSELIYGMKLGRRELFIEWPRSAGARACTNQAMAVIYPALQDMPSG